MEHRATADFWSLYRDLPEEIRTRAERQFALLKSDARHPSLMFKKIGDRQGEEVWSARVTLNYRAVAIKRSEGFPWFWIGDHKTYDTLLN